MVEAMSYAGIEREVKTHPGFFSEIYQERDINNIYFDTPTLSYYHHNQDGAAHREKVRIRWYGRLKGEIAQPILEIKKKRGMTGSKRSFKLKSFSLEDSLTNHTLAQVFRSSDLPEDVLEKVMALKATLVNRYRRKYYLDFSGNYRITLDRMMSYHPVLEERILPLKMYEEEGTVVELKYDASHDDEASRISNLFPFRLSKNSKYVKGIEMFYPIAL